MKIYWNDDLLEIGSAGLRCGRWIIKHRKDKGKTNKALKEYYAGKWYAYLYVLSLVGITEFIARPEKIYDFSGWLHTFRQGKIVLFANELSPIILMDKKFFFKILESKQPHQGPRITKEIARMCREIT